jgi:hypothetical protein
MGGRHLRRGRPRVGVTRLGTRRSPFTAVGYGGQEAVNQPGGPVIGYVDTREFAVSTFNAIGPDFGGPNFLGAGPTETDIIAGITITGDSLCKSTNVIYRPDTESARAFLDGYVALP